LRIKRPSKREGVQFRIHDYRFFEELDRGTQIGMSNVPERNSWEIKILKYIKYYEDENLYKKRYETTAGRTLVIIASLARLERLREITRKAGGDDRFWFTTIDQIRECVDLQTWQLWGEVQCRAWANLSNRNWEHLSKEELKKEVTKQVRIESKKINWFNPKENNTPPLVPNLKSILTEPIWQKAGEDGWFTLFKD